MDVLSSNLVTFSWPATHFHFQDNFVLIWQIIIKMFSREKKGEFNVGYSLTNLSHVILSCCCCFSKCIIYVGKVSETHTYTQHSSFWYASIISLLMSSCGSCKPRASPFFCLFAFVLCCCFASLHSILIKLHNVGFVGLKENNKHNTLWHHNFNWAFLEMFDVISDLREAFFIPGIPCPIIVAWAIGKLYYENEQWVS